MAPDTTPPDFDGIKTLTDLANGAIQIGFDKATDPGGMGRYEVHIKKDSTLSISDLNSLLYRHSTFITDTGAATYLANYSTDADGQPLDSGSTYYVAVRARDANSNLEENAIVLSVVSTNLLVAHGEPWTRNLLAEKPTLLKCVDMDRPQGGKQFVNRET